MNFVCPQAIKGDIAELSGLTITINKGPRRRGLFIVKSSRAPPLSCDKTASGALDQSGLEKGACVSCPPFPLSADPYLSVLISACDIRGLRIVLQPVDLSLEFGGRLVANGGVIGYLCCTAIRRMLAAEGRL